MNDPIIIPVMEHYEAYLNGKFICSGDTETEIEEELKEMSANAQT